MWNMIKRVLITGGAGFIGINTANRFLQKDRDITIFDNFSRKGTRENVKWLLQTAKRKPKIIEADIVKDRKKLSEEINKTELVLHFASQVAVTKSIRNPMHDFKVNVLGTLHILEAIRKSQNKPVLLFSSTNKVYGDLKNVAIHEEKTRYSLKNLPHGISEDYPMSFKSPYGCSKGAADQYIHDYANIYGLRTIVFRQSCIYGPHQFGIEDQGWIAWFIIAALLGKKITIYGNGKQVRDLLYIDDLVNAYDLAIQHIDKTSGKIYNIGGGVKNSISIWQELHPILEKLFQKSVEIKLARQRPGDQKLFIADIRKAKKDFGWEPKVGINKGIALVYQWAVENQKMLEKYLG
jgi:CDP-paratose 2-epimerase